MALTKTLDMIAIAVAIFICIKYLFTPLAGLEATLHEAAIQSESM